MTAVTRTPKTKTVMIFALSNPNFWKIIPTKLDKIKRSQLQKNIKIIRQTLECEPGTVIIPFSAETKQGRDEIWDLIETEYLNQSEEA